MLLKLNRPAVPKKSHHFVLLIGLLLSRERRERWLTTTPVPHDFDAQVPEGGEITFKLGEGTTLKASALASIRDEIDALPGTIATSVVAFASDL